jgi:hypothetical protein
MPHHSSIHSIAKQTLPSCYSLRHHLGKLHSVASRAIRREVELLDSSDMVNIRAAVRRAQHHYLNNSRTHRRLRVTGRPRAVATPARRISAVRWTLRSGVWALSEVSMSNGRSRRSIGLTTTRKRFYVPFFLFCVSAHILFFFLQSSSWVARMTFTNVLLLTTSFCNSTVVPMLWLFVRLSAYIHLILE